MNAPDRPTREQVEEVLHRADQRYATDDERIFAAEVRAQRAELDEVHEFGLTLGLRPAPHVRLDVAAVLGYVRDLVARTPQPAETAIYRCDQSDHPAVPCSRCELVTAAPLPAVPDGEDEPRLRKIGEELSDCPCCGSSADVCAGVSGCCEQCAEIGRLNMHATTPPWPELFTDPPIRRRRVLDGEDVPARLDAAAEALEARGKGLGGWFRQAANDMRRLRPDDRAAVAAALADRSGPAAQEVREE